MSKNVINWFLDVANNFRHNDTGIPHAYEFWSASRPIHLILLTSTLTALLLICVLAGVHIYFLLKYCSNEGIRSDLYYMVFIPVITSACSNLGMAIPRSAAFLYAVTVSYNMLVLFMIVKLMFTMFGSRRALLRYLENKNKKIKLAVPPYCTKFTCLPDMPGTKKYLFLCESMILQCVILRMIQQVADIVVFLELGHRNNAFFTISHVLGITSLVIAFYFVYILIDLGQERLTPYRYSTLFRIVDFSQTLVSCQKFGIDILIAVFPTTNRTQTMIEGVFFYNFLLCWEMLFLSILVTYLCAPSKSFIFDKYNRVVEITAEVLPTREDIIVGRSRDQDELLDELAEKNQDKEIQQQKPQLKPQQKKKRRKNQIMAPSVQQDILLDKLNRSGKYASPTKQKEPLLAATQFDSAVDNSQSRKKPKAVQEVADKKKSDNSEAAMKSKPIT